MSRFSTTVHETLLHAGWFEGRDALDTVKLLREFELFPAAEKVLREFGSLQFGVMGPGKEQATCHLHIDPVLMEGSGPELTQRGKELGLKLYPVAEVEYGHAHLVIDEQGRIYMLTDELMPYAGSFDRVLEILLIGLKREKFVP